MKREIYEDAEFDKEIYQIFRDFFNLAERKRRWSIEDDIPWDKCSKSLNPAIADIVESFCAVELFLPDYLAPMVSGLRSSRGAAWFMCNWGYEEAKHSLALGDWLLKSGMRTDEQFADVQKMCVDNAWTPPMETPIGMACYTVAQELATAVSYRRLSALFNAEDDPALSRLLEFIHLDERAHFGFYRKMVALHLRYDRAHTLEQLRQVLNNFHMPMIEIFADSRHRVAEIRRLNIMTEEIYVQEIYLPILASLGIERREMRNRSISKKSIGNPEVAQV